MNSLFKNQLLKELRNHSGLLAIWCGLLLLGTVRALGETATVFTEDGRGYHISPSENTFALLALIGLAIALPMMLGVSDSPTRSEGFIQTRPVPARTVWLAKIAFLGIFLALPAALEPFIVAIVEGGGIGIAMAAAFDRLVFVSPVLLFFLCWGGLNAGGRKMGTMTLIGTAIILAFFFITIAIVNFVGDDAQLFHEYGSLQSRFVVTYWLAAALGVFALWRQLSGKRRKSRPVFLSIGVGLAVAFAFGMPGINFLLPTNKLPGEIATAMKQAEAVPNPFEMRAWRSADSEPGKQPEVMLHLQTPIRIENTPGHIVVQPSVKNATLSGPDGFSSDTVGSRGVNQRGRVRTSRSILQAAVEVLGKEVTAYDGNDGSDFGKTPPLTVVRWKANGALEERFDDPLSLEFELSLGCVGVKHRATMPFKHDSTAGTNPRITVKLPPTPIADSMWFAIRMRVPQLLLTRNPDRKMQSGYQMRRRFLCLLTNPNRKESLFCGFSSGNFTRGMLSGYPELYLLFEHTTRDFGSTFGSDFYENAELHVFQIEWLGEHTVTARMDGFRASERLIHLSRVIDARSDRRGYLRALENLGPLPETPTAEDTINTLKAIDLRRQWRLELADPGYQRIMEIGNRDIGVLIAGLGQSNHQSQQVLLDVIGQLANEESKPEIIAAVERSATLAEVITAHGWEADAKDALFAALRSRRALPLEALRAIALLDDPETHPYLLDHFTHLPDVRVYNLLAKIPGLQPQLDRIVQERWVEERGSIVKREHHDNRTLDTLALRSGNKKALEVILNMLKHDDYSARRALRPVMLLPQRENDIRKQLAPLTSDDFEFDPTMRMFRQLPDNANKSKEENPS